MKRLLFLLMITLAAGSVSAQPKNFRSQQSNAAQKKQQQQKTQGVTERMRIMYPTALDMPEDVVWRRDIYREINLDDEMNSGLYFPVEPVGKQMNLFTYILKLAINGYIPVYEYTPLQVKVAVTGYGKALKPQVMEMTRRLLHLKDVPKPDDTADALALALTHTQAAGTNLRDYMMKKGIK